MKKNKINWLFLFVFSITIISFSACTKEADLGIGVLPEGDIVGVYFQDTFSVELSSMEKPALKTSDLGRCMMGQYMDPEFGGMEAASYLQFNTTGNDVVFGEDTSKLELDSLVLTLAINGYYGRNTDIHKLSIHEIKKEDFHEDSTYFSNSVVSVYSDQELSDNYKLSYSGKDFSSINLISITLDASLGNKILSASKEELSSNISFSEFFKGLRIKGELENSPNREPGGIYFIDVASGLNSMRLFYRDDSVSKSYEFSVNSNSAHFYCLNRYNHEGKIFNQEFNNPDSDYSFIQAGLPIWTKVSFPYLDSLGPLGINRAELILKVPAGIGASLNVMKPPSIEAYATDSTGLSFPDGASTTSTGVYSAEDQEVVIPLTNTMIQTLNGSLNNNGIILKASSENLTTNRIIFYNQNNPEFRPRLKIVFTSFPEL